jgi:hypothetical protein
MNRTFGTICCRPFDEPDHRLQAAPVAAHPAAVCGDFTHFEPVLIP